MGQGTWGLKAPFIGYLFDFENLQGGLTQRRCDWLVGWLRKVVRDKIIVGRELRSGLGRLSFSAVLWRWMLPFLGPFYAWIAVSEDSAAWQLPVALLIIMEWIAKQIEQNAWVTLRHLAPQGLGKFFKADARADGDIVVVGGFESVPGRTLMQCRWFSFTLSPVLTPWAYVKVGEAYRTIATLELFATLLCIMLFVEEQPTSRTSTLYMTGVTDNAGNEALIVKCMTSKFPLYIVLLELTEQLKSKNVSLDLRWQSRELNVAADDLTNDKFDNFDAALRVDPNLNHLDWKVLPSLLKDAMALEVLIQERKAAPKDNLPKKALLKGFKRKAVGLRVSDPW